MKKSQIAMIVIIGGIVVFLIKIVAFLVSDSIALLSDALESIINIIASLLLFVSLRIAERPPDTDHEFGHRKAENVSCLVEGLLIIMAAIFIMIAGIGRLIDPVNLTDVDMAMIVSLLATSINGALAVMLFRESKRINSIAMEGDSKHLLTDVISSVGVVIGLFIATITGLFILDPLMAFFVGAGIVKMGYDLITKSCGDLLDHNCPECEDVVIRTLDSINGHIEYHDLKTRKSGEVVYVMFHLCVDGNMSVYDSHELTERIELRLKERIPMMDLTIHVETENQRCVHRDEEGLFV
ncbi:MAG: cation diffusion facilitator family transporter [Methanomassiliicoccales archaeon]